MAVAATTGGKERVKRLEFSVGDTFESFENLEANIKKNEQANFWRRDSRTIEAVKKRLNPTLKYYELKFCCIYGRQNFYQKKRDKNYFVS